MALHTLFDSRRQAEALPLPDELAQWYGKLFMRLRDDGPTILGNFVSSLDGVVSLDEGKSGGAAISGSNGPDLMIMGLLRAAADAVMEGAGTLRGSPQSVLSPGDVCPALEGPFAEFRRRMGKPAAPLNVIVSWRGDLDPGMRVFQSPELPVMILTGTEGAKSLAKRRMPAWVKIRQIPGEEKLDAAALIKGIGLSKGQILLVEGGPQLLGTLLKAGQLHELFLTLAPQVAGRDDECRRPGFVSGQAFAPQDPRWANLIGIKQAQSHLFLRYDFSGAFSEK